MSRITASALTILFFVSLSANAQYKKSTSKDYITDVKEITDIMVFDVTSPVAAARYYAYSNLAAYEVMSTQEVVKYPSYSGISNFKFLTPVASVVILKNKALCYRYAMVYTAFKMLPSGSKLSGQINFYKTSLLDFELKFVEKIADAIIDYANKDGFSKLNNLKRYTPKRGPAFWQPTKPGFMAPVEPNWNTIKTFFLERPDQFITKRPVKFDLDPTSEFYKITMEVKEVVDQNDKEKNEIAAFWDCNPYAISQIGHLEFGLKKISPGGHWMGIAGIACKKAKFSLDKTIFTHTILALSLHDAFVACWDEKYRSDRIRPETVINKYIDKFWNPLLQTPPFPEYVSGHSVVSTSSSKILTIIFGKNFKFRDTSEKEYGLKTRKFKSFDQAASEARISRLYGGIHYMDAIVEGEWQGIQVADYIFQKTKRYFNFDQF